MSINDLYLNNIFLPFNSMDKSFKMSLGLNPLPSNSFRVVGYWLSVGEPKGFQQVVDMI